MRGKNGFAYLAVDSCGKRMTLFVHMPTLPTAPSIHPRRRMPLERGYAFSLNFQLNVSNNKQKHGFAAFAINL